MPRVLFVSNGVGEDLIASRIISEMEPAGLEIQAYPLAGIGAYPPGTALLDPRRDLPSGGFSLRSGFRGLGADLTAGLLTLWWAQRRTLTRERGRCGLAVAVGDVYCLSMAARAHPRPALVATADSVRIRRFDRFSLRIMRRHAREVLARDADTAGFLAREGIPARYVGNVMMDLPQPTGETFGVPPDTPVVTLLPGSRRDAVENAVVLAQAAAAVAAALPATVFLIAVAPTIAAERLRDRLRRQAGAAERAGGDVEIGGARLRVTTAFADAVTRAWLVLGMAGTAHEQAAGLGRPVVAFPGSGAQFGHQFLDGQRRLLGDAIIATRNWREAAAAVVRLLKDHGERARRGAAGRQSMGPPGGAQRIARALRGMIQNA